jgi:polyphosphate glucokinase
VAVSGQVPIAIGIDVGGSGIKGAAVDLASGKLASNRHRILTPQPATPQACLQVIGRIFKAIKRDLPEAATAPIGVGVPSVVIDGITKSAANIDPGWVDFPAANALARILGRPVCLVNDADAAGLAEMRFGAGRGRSGTVLVLTLGTGLGSGFFVDGRLVPNTELGHMEIRGRDAERRSAAAARVRRGLSWKAWAEDLDEHLNAMHRLFWPTLIIMGGGVSKNAEKFIPRLTVPTQVVPAELRNEAGIIGAAMFAAEAAQQEAAAAVEGAAAETEGPAELEAAAVEGAAAESEAALAELEAAAVEGAAAEAEGPAELDAAAAEAVVLRETDALTEAAVTNEEPGPTEEPGAAMELGPTEEPGAAMELEGPAESEAALAELEAEEPAESEAALAELEAAAVEGAAAEAEGPAESEAAAAEAVVVRETDALVEAERAGDALVGAWLEAEAGAVTMARTAGARRDEPDLPQATSESSPISDVALGPD